MSFTVPNDILLATTASGLKQYREWAKSPHRGEKDVDINTPMLTEGDLQDLSETAKKLKNPTVHRAAEAIIAARSGSFDKSVPNIKPFEELLLNYLKSNLIDGWIYVTRKDGRAYPELVLDIRTQHGSFTDPEPKVILRTAVYGPSIDSRYDGLQTGTREYAFRPGDVTRKRISDILMNQGIVRETAELKAAYAAEMARHAKYVEGKFAKQFIFSGSIFAYCKSDYRNRVRKLENRKVIHDLDKESFKPIKSHYDSVLFADDSGDGVGEVPFHPVIRVFDLQGYEYYWVHSGYLEPYVYDKTLKSKLILPKTHHELLEVLTTDLDEFVDDVVDGKKAGNIILIKGVMGIGKTLTAEVYAEENEKPLYKVSSGFLGTTPEEVEKGLSDVFQLSKRWGCYLLLDECDVLVRARGNDLIQNAIVAEFLRVMEYYDGILFMTTNRAEDIDEAVLDRCIAIINYDVPSREDAERVWAVMADNFKVDLDDDLVNELLDLFPKIRPRSIKMLLRVVLKMQKNRGCQLDSDLFQTCAVFRNIEIAKIPQLEEAA